MDQNDEYKSKYWSQVNKRKNIEQSNNNSINDLLSRIYLLETKDIEGTIIKINCSYYIIKTEIGIFQVNKNNLKNNGPFSSDNLNKPCIFNLYYKDNKYMGTNLYIKYEFD
jgi:hypothetical protein